MKCRLRSIFLTSEKPEATATFYRDVAHLELIPVGKPGEVVYWKSDQDGLQIAIHEATKFAPYTHPARRESNLTHLYFTIEDQAAFVEHLGRLGLVPLLIDEVVVTVIDPDGRKVMFGTA